MEPKPVLYEWLRVVMIFIVTFALMVVLAGMAGVQVDWAENSYNPPEVYNMPY